MEGTTGLTRSGRIRLGSGAAALALVVLLSACELGSTDVAGGETGPTTTAPTGPTEATGPTAATGPTGAGVLEGTWSGTWDTDVPQVEGTFSWVIEATPDGFTGTIEVQNTTCISNGTVDVSLDGDRITVGQVQAEQPVTFTGTISGDRMSRTYDAGTCPPPNAGTREAVRSAQRSSLTRSGRSGRYDRRRSRRTAEQGSPPLGFRGSPVSSDRRLARLSRKGRAA